MVKLLATTLMSALILAFISSQSGPVNAVGYQRMLTTGPAYDRNPSFFKASDGTWWLFFVRGRQRPDHGDQSPSGVADGVPGHGGGRPTTPSYRVEASYLGTVSGGGDDRMLGRFSITMQVRYLLSLETGLGLIVRGLNGVSEVLSRGGHHPDGVHGAHRHLHLWVHVPPNLAGGSYSITFDASAEYVVDGGWYHGDDGSAAASVSIIPSP